MRIPAHVVGVLYGAMVKIAWGTQGTQGKGLGLRVGAEAEGGEAGDDEGKEENGVLTSAGGGFSGGEETEEGGEAQRAAKTKEMRDTENTGGTMEADEAGEATEATKAERAAQRRGVIRFAFLTVAAVVVVFPFGLAYIVFLFMLLVVAMFSLQYLLAVVCTSGKSHCTIQCSEIFTLRNENLYTET